MLTLASTHYPHTLPAAKVAAPPAQHGLQQAVPARPPGWAVPRLGGRRSKAIAEEGGENSPCPAGGPSGTQSQGALGLCPPAPNRPSAKATQGVQALRHGDVAPRAPAAGKGVCASALAVHSLNRGALPVTAKGAGILREEGASPSAPPEEPRPPAAAHGSLFPGAGQPLHRHPRWRASCVYTSK